MAYFEYDEATETLRRIGEWEDDDDRIEARTQKTVA
jgi:hypothetical protein